MIVNIFEARNRLSALVRAARAGESVVIANRGKPVARLVPIEEDDVGGSGNVDEILAWLDANPLPPHMGRTIEEIDACLEAERAAWDRSTSTPAC